MSSKTQVKLPNLDFSEEAVNPGSNSWFSTCKKVRDALEEYSCFIVQYPAIEPELIDAIFLASEEIFDLPIETKLENKRNPDKLFGYIGQIPHNPTFEGMAIEDPTSQEALEKFTTLMWPSGNDRFCETVGSYTNRVSKLEQMVMGMIFESFGVEEFHGKYYQSCSNFIAFNKHRPPLLNEEIGGVQEHTDPTFITLLQQNQISGLEVKSKDGSWISVDLSPSSFLVMAGDALLAWSNGRVHSTLHRVKRNSREILRLSIALASYYNGTIETPEELVDKEHPLTFKPFDHLGYFRFTFTSAPYKDERKMTVYCGI